MKSYSRAFLVRSCALLLYVGTLSAQQDPVRVFVLADQPELASNDFVDPAAQIKAKALADSVKDIHEAIARKSKVLRLVERREDAAIVIEVKERGWRPTGKTTVTHRPGVFGLPATSEQKAEERQFVTARLLTGGLKLDLDHQSDDAFCGYRCVANALADKIVKFVEANRSRF